MDERPEIRPETENAARTDNAGRRRRFRPKFSLATLLVLVTIGCLLAALWATSQRLDALRAELAETRRELQKYRDELGYVTISDPNKAHATGIRTPGRLRWQWRVYVPKSRRFRLCAAARRIPANGVAKSHSATTVPSGEFVVHARVERDQRGQWVFTVEEPTGSVSIAIPEANASWVEGNASWQFSQVAPGSTEVEPNANWEFPQVAPGRTGSFPPGGPLVLLRLRVNELIREQRRPNGAIAREHRAPAEPCDGVMIWIQEGQAARPGTPSAPGPSADKGPR